VQILTNLEDQVSVVRDREDIDSELRLLAAERRSVETGSTSKKRSQWFAHGQVVLWAKRGHDRATTVPRTSR
jgi:hypothetical protein